MSNCHIVCLIWSRKAAIVMKHQWRDEDYTAWAIHGTIHPFIALGFPHCQSRKYSGACEGWMWAGGGRQECWGNRSDKWCISALHCALCFDMTTPLWGHAVELRRNKGWLFSERERSGSSLSIPQCVRRILACVDFTPLQMTIINDECIISSGQLWSGKSVACMPVVHSGTAHCFSVLKANPVESSFGVNYNAALQRPAMVSLGIAVFNFFTW